MERLTTLIRLLLGTVYLVNGVNWFFKIITPYPSISDFIEYMPPPDIVGALIDQGILFHLAKAIEVVTGLALLSNRFVPLGLVVSMTVTVPVFITDVFKPEWRLRAFLMGSGSLVMNVYLLLAYYDYYRSMLAFRSVASADPATAHGAEGDVVADVVGYIVRPIMRVLGPLAAIMGVVMVAWLAVMIVQYALHPQAIYEVRHLVPRPSIR